MWHDWYHLLFLHWSVPVEALRPLVPEGLEIDTFEGRAYVGLIPFGMARVRPVFMPPVPFLSRFPEVNVRTYVHRQGRDPGVWFSSLDAASRLTVAGARALYHLPYFHARMSLEETGEAGRPTIRYASDRIRPGPRPASCRIRYAPRGEPAEARPGTLEHFLVERYVLYSEARGTLFRGRVHHAPYPLQGADVPQLEESLIAAAGVVRPDEAPRIHYASRVRVRVYPLRKVETRNPSRVPREARTCRASRRRILWPPS